MAASKNMHLLIVQKERFLLFESGAGQDFFSFKNITQGIVLVYESGVTRLPAREAFAEGETGFG